MILIEEMLQPSRILMDLPNQGKSEALRAMADRLESQSIIQDAAEVHHLLMDREGLMTTGVKRGFAFPHAFSKQFESSFLTLGCVPGGVAYDSLDGHPVEFIFMLLGPPTHQTIHLRTLARISRLTAQPEMLDLLRSATTSENVLELLIDSERRLKAFPFSADRM
jgi:PTS system fructose-specific IIC component